MPASRCALPAAALALLVGGLVAPPAAAEPDPPAVPEPGPAPGAAASDDAGFRHATVPPGAHATSAPTAGTLEVQVLDRNGDTPTAEQSWYVLVLGLDEESDFTAVLVDGAASVEVPAGRYSLAAFVRTPEPDGVVSRTLVVDPLVEVAPAPDTGSEVASIPVALDARTARAPVTVAVADRPAAEGTGGVVLFSQPGAAGGTTHPWYAYNLDPEGRNYVTPTERVAGSHLYVYSELTRHGAAESPYTYHLVSDAPGRVPARPSFTHRTGDLAELRSTVAAQGDPECAVIRGFTAVPGESVGFGGFGATLTTPGRHTSYFSPGPQDWSLSGHYADPECDTSGPTDSFRIRRAFPTATTSRETWGRAPLGPALGDTAPVPEADRPFWAYGRREGDRLVLDVPMAVDSGPGHHASGALRWPSGTSGSTTLSVDGREVGASDLPAAGDFAVGPEPATYVVDAVVERDYPWSGLSPEQQVRWTFRSAHDPDAVPDALPLHVVRFEAGLDQRGRAPAGPFELGIRLENWPGAPVGTVEDVTIEASYDDGATWRPAPVVPAPGGAGGWVATLDHPAGASWVSLRAHAADTDGNAVDQTVVRAYGLRG